jgi:hypothetical protein
MISYQQRFLHRSGGYPVILEKKNIDKGYGNNCKNYCIEPFDKAAVWSVTALPEGPVDFLGYIDIINYGKTGKQPVIAYPDDDQDIQQGGNAKPDVLSLECLIHFIRLDKNM